MNKSIIFCALATLTLMACSASDDNADEQQGVPSAPRPLTVVVNETPFVDENGEALAPMRPGTRGTLITTPTLTSFSMNYGENKYGVERIPSTGEWATTPVDTWPVDGADTPISFYAYNAGTFYPGGDNCLTFSVDENASTQTDLLVAKHENISFSEANGAVSLTFAHACAAVDIEVKISNKLHTQLGTDLTVKSILLQNIYKTGDYHFGTNSWESLSTKTYFTLTNASMTVTTTEQSLSCGTLFLLPQTLGDDAQLLINYGDDKQATIPLTGETLAPGTHYTWSFVLGTTLIQ